MNETREDGFEWDELKRARNIDRRKLDFIKAASIWLGPVVQRRSDRGNEERYISYGAVGCWIVAVVWTPRGGRKRIISARRANRNERKDYAVFLGRTQGGQD